MVKSIVLKDGDSENPYIIWDNLETTNNTYHHRRGQITLSEELEGGQRVIFWKGPNKKDPHRRFDFEALGLTLTSDDDEKNQEKVYKTSARYAREIAYVNDAMFLDDTERGKRLGKIETKLLTDLKFMK